MKNLFLLFIITLFSLSNVTAQKLTAFKANNGLWGFMDSKTKAEIIKPQYNDAHGFSFGYAAVKKSGKWFYIDKSGQKIYDGTFDKAGNFNEYGEAIVYINGDWGTLTPAGLLKAKGTTITILKETYLQQDKLGWSKEEYDGTAKMVDGVDWNAYTNNKLAKTGDELYKKNEPVEKIYFHKNGKTSAKGKEINGKKVGQWIFYSENGCIISTENYNNDGVADGNFTRSFCFKKEHGAYTVYNPNYSTGKFKNCKNDGLIDLYNPNNGKPTYSELWDNGVYKKVKDIYDYNGNLVSSTGTGTVNWHKEDSKYLAGRFEYQNGHRAGIAVWYHPNKINSQVKQKALYKYDANAVYGLRWEIIEINDINGKPLPKGTLKNGNGIWISYDDYDKPTVITTYQNGKKVKEETALVKDIDKIYENILPKETNPYAEIALSNSSYEVVKGRNELSEKKYTQAFKSFEIAANKGDQEAMVYLGEMYYEGLGVAKDYKKAYEWILKAKNKGNADAAFKLGIMYQYGNGVAQSYAEAYSWYNVAAAKGIANADYNIGLLFESGKGVEKNLQSAFNHYKKAAETGSGFGNYKMSHAYYFGVTEAGIAKDYKKALEYAKTAKEDFGNNPAFVNHLAYCYFLSGNKKMAYGILSNLTKTHKDYANGFDSLGEVCVALAFTNEAIKSYKQAAQMGHENAIKWCRNNNVTY
ncbi:WG repeat-containing protein [Pedobacter sp.]